MKPVPTKSDVRDEIEQQVQDFLSRGGSVKQVRSGTSGLADGEPPPSMAFDRPKQDRTPVPEVVAAIDSRRSSRTKPKKTIKARRGPRKKIIYDDFGEPIREIWIEDE